MSRLALFLLFVSLPFLMDDGPRESGKQADISRFDGEWVVTFYEEAGVSLSSDITKDWHMTFSDESINGNYIDGSKLAGKIRLDPTKTPKEIDLDWNDKGTVRGIYEFDGDQLKICVGSKPDQRPKKFASNLASGTCMMILERPKKSK